MLARPELPSQWPEQLTKGNGAKIAKAIRMCSSAGEVVDWSARNFRSLGLAGLALAFSYVANNPGEVRENSGLDFAFDSRIDVDEANILSKINVGDDIRRKSGSIVLNRGISLREDYAMKILGKDGALLDLDEEIASTILAGAKRKSSKGKQTVTVENLKETVLVRLHVDNINEPILLIQDQIAFSTPVDPALYHIPHHLEIKSARDIKRSRKTLEKILIEMDGNLAIPVATG